MTQDQFMGLLRQLLPFLAGVATGKGWLTMEQAGDLTALILQIGGPLFLVGGSIWSYIANSKRSILLAAGQMPEVEKVVLKNGPQGTKLAESVPIDKVDTK